MKILDFKKCIKHYSSLFLTLILMTALSCSDSSENSLISDNTGEANVLVQISKVNKIGKSRSIELSKLYVSLSASGEAVIYDTIVITGNEQIVVPIHYENLASLKIWTITAETRDNSAIVIHSGTLSFEINPNETTTANVVLMSAFSMLNANFLNIADSVTRCELHVDDVLKSDSSFEKQSHSGETITLTYDYLEADNNNHNVRLDVYGEMWGEEKLLYTGDTTIPVLSGVDENYNVKLRWVGPDLPPAGQAEITVTLGNTGTVTINGDMATYVSDISAGLFHSLVVDLDGKLWASGRNMYGELGTGDTVKKITPVCVSDNVKTVSAGADHSLILKTDNTVWTTGDNKCGQLGNSTNTQSEIFIQVMDDVKLISAGDVHNLIIKNDNTLWAFGGNDFGQLGDGSRTDRNSCVHIMSDVKDVCASGRFSIILKNDNTVWTMGDNRYGQLGDGTLSNRWTPIQIMTDAKDIAGGQGHAMILKNDNTVWVSGRNDFGQLGDGTTSWKKSPVQIMTDVQNIGASAYHSVFLKPDNTLWATGTNSSGQFGNGTTNGTLTPIQVAADVKSFDAGGGHTLIIKNDNTLLATGHNGNGQLGDGTTDNKSTPVKPGIR